MATRIQRAIGSNLPRGSLQVTIFIPNKDREGGIIDQDGWARQALELLGRLFRGATAFPPGRGVWRDDSSAGRLLHEITVMVTSYTNPREHGAAALQELGDFLHRFGRETNQGEVGIVVGDQYFGISEYRNPESTGGRGSRR